MYGAVDTLLGIGVCLAPVTYCGFCRSTRLKSVIWLGLVPRQHTTGGKPRLFGISKRGNTYLRTLLIHGARAALPSLSQSDTPLGRWLKAMIERGVHRNAVVVALANKLAQIAWAALRKGATFERGHPVAA
nr:transposase [Shimia sp.]